MCRRQRSPDIRASRRSTGSSRWYDIDSGALRRRARAGGSNIRVDRRHGSRHTPLASLGNMVASSRSGGLTVLPGDPSCRSSAELNSTTAALRVHPPGSVPTFRPAASTPRRPVAPWRRRPERGISRRPRVPRQRRADLRVREHGRQDFFTSSGSGSLRGWRCRWAGRA